MKTTTIIYTCDMCGDEHKPYGLSHKFIGKNNPKPIERTIGISSEFYEAYTDSHFHLCLKCLKKTYTTIIGFM
jgi:hypothetical protein